MRYTRGCSPRVIAGQRRLMLRVCEQSVRCAGLRGAGSSCLNRDNDDTVWSARVRQCGPPCTLQIRLTHHRPMSHHRATVGLRAIFAIRQLARFTEARESSASESASDWAPIDTSSYQWCAGRVRMLNTCSTCKARWTVILDFGPVRRPPGIMSSSTPPSDKRMKPHPKLLQNMTEARVES